MEAGDLVWLVAFVAWLLSGLLGRFARRRLAPPQQGGEGKREPRSDEDHDRAAAHRRLLEQLGVPEEELEPWEDEEEDLGWSPPPAPAPAARAAAASSTAKPAVPPSFRPLQPPPLRTAPRPAKAVAADRPPTRRYSRRHAELARAMVLADILDRPVALRTPRTP